MGLRSTHGVESCGREKKKQERGEGEASKAPPNPVGSFGARMVFQMARPLYSIHYWI